MTQQQFQQPTSDLGFDFEIGISNNYPEEFVTAEQIEKERKLNLGILKDLGVSV